jgi:hypothetical protein
VSWCKRFEVPLEKMYTRVLLDKFGVRWHCDEVSHLDRERSPSCPLQWAMETDRKFDF